MKKIFLWLLPAFIFGMFAGKLLFENKSTFFGPTETPVPRLLDKYAIDNLSRAEVKNSSIEVGKPLSEGKNHVSYLFNLEFDSELTSNKLTKTTGQINIPKESGPFPIIVMIRGYVDQKIYQTGTGTKRAAEVFADSGYITIAPDFLGYGGSDSEAGNIFESRFQTYVTVMSLLSAIHNLPKWDGGNIFIWAHSNGGQIAFTVLAVTGGAYPTTLWAPVSKPFPYSVLYYTDESDDGGKLIRKELAKFEDLYDTDIYSFTNYLDRINAPLQIHQGGADDAVPTEWTNEIVERLKKLNKDLEYYTYPKNDHNMQPDWDMVVQRDLDFFAKHLK